jgi:hypothetical protein
VGRPGTANLPRAIATYRTLLDAVEAAGVAPEKNLGIATDLSRLYDALTPLYRRAGNHDLAQDLHARRANTWRHWAQQLPSSAFVRAQIAAPE